jgi:hypothetical protein
MLDILEFLVMKWMAKTEESVHLILQTKLWTKWPQRCAALIFNKWAHSNLKDSLFVLQADNRQRDTLAVQKEARAIRASELEKQRRQVMKTKNLSIFVFFLLLPQFCNFQNATWIINDEK